MATGGRVIGHGLGAFFVLLGAMFLVLASAEGPADWLDEHSTCNGGNCSDTNASTTFWVLGISFVAGGVVSSAVTEFAIRKTRRFLPQVAASPQDFSTAEGVADFLRPFGIEIDPAARANVEVERRVVDLRGERKGDVPRDPAGLSNYLRSLGITIPGEALRNATIVGTADDSPGVQPAPAPSTVPDLVRETATIRRKRDRGETAGDQRLLELELEVRPAGKPPYLVELATLVRSSLASLLIEGSTLNVRVVANEPHAVTIDWAEN